MYNEERFLPQQNEENEEKRADFEIPESGGSPVRERTSLDELVKESRAASPKKRATERSVNEWSAEESEEKTKGRLEEESEEKAKGRLEEEPEKETEEKPEQQQQRRIVYSDIKDMEAGQLYKPLDNDWIKLHWTEEQCNWWKGGKDKKFAEDKTILDFQLVQELYVAEKKNPDFLRIPPNMALFWSGCDFYEKNITMAVKKSQFWGSKERELSEILDRSKRDPKIVEGEIVTRMLAKGHFFETLKEMSLQADGGKIRGKTEDTFYALSGGMAKRASGTVFFARGNEKTDYGKFWRRIELPTLMKNKNADIIVEIDAKDPSVIRSIILPEKLNAEKLSECTFPIPKSCLPDGCIRGTRLEEDGRNFVTCKDLNEAGIKQVEMKGEVGGQQKRVKVKYNGMEAELEYIHPISGVKGGDETCRDLIDFDKLIEDTRGATTRTKQILEARRKAKEAGNRKTEAKKENKEPTLE